MLLISYALHAQVARETNEELRAIRADSSDGFDIEAILSIARRCFFCHLGKQLGLKVTYASIIRVLIGLLCL